MPDNSAAAVDVPAALMNVLLVVFFISPLCEEYVGRHDVRVAVGRAGRRLLQEGAGEDMRVAGADHQLRRQRFRRLNVELLPDVGGGGAGRNARQQRAASGVEPGAFLVPPPRVVGGGGRYAFERNPLDTGTQVPDVAPANLVGKAVLVVRRGIQLIEGAACGVGGVLVAAGVIELAARAEAQRSRRRRPHHVMTRPGTDIVAAE